jgi:hypothetical protein
MKVWRQLVRIACQRGTQSVTDFRPDGAAMDAIDLNTVWIRARHDGSICCNSNLLPDQVPEGELVHSRWEKAEGGFIRRPA